MLSAFWEFTADVIRTGWNVDKLPPSPRELIRLVGSHRAPERFSMVPPEIARETEVRSIPVRSLAWLAAGVKR